MLSTCEACEQFKEDVNIKLDLRQKDMLDKFYENNQKAEAAFL